jgi:hypothetical protein
MSRMTRITTILCTAGAAGVLGAAVPAFAAGPTEIIGGGNRNNNYTLTAAPGTTNNLSVSMGTLTGSDGNVYPAYVFSDTAGLTTPLFLSCTGGTTVDPNTGRQSGQELRCYPPETGPLDDPALKIDVGDGDDRVTIAQGPTAPHPAIEQQIKGGGGNDSLTGSAQNPDLFGPFIQGGPGNDRLFTSGAHNLSGEGGVDKLSAKNGVRNRRINCGPGSDKRESAKRDKKDAKAVSC